MCIYDLNEFLEQVLFCYHKKKSHHLLAHDCQEVIKRDLASAVLIYFGNHFLDLFFFGLKTKSPHSNLIHERLH